MHEAPAVKVSVYVVAHADDWQLFMQPNGYKDLVDPDTKIIFIITTAGDAGMEKMYWSAREEGLKSSLRFCLAPLGALYESGGTKERNGHRINYWSINNASCYFLRLPDGGLDGAGFSTCGFQGLNRLKAGHALNAVDDSTTYQNWADFYNTLQGIIHHETEETNNAWVHYLSPDKSYNPDDHADHWATGEALQAMPVINKLQQVLYAGYSTGITADTLQPTDLFWKAGMFAAYEKAVFDLSGYSTLHEGVQTYIAWNLTGAHFTIIPAHSKDEDTLTL